MSKIAVIVLAAGESSRMQQVKQLLPYKNTTLLEHVLLTAINTDSSRVICVLGAHHEEILKRKIIPNQVQIKINRVWSSGIGSSIVCGIQQVLEITENIDAVVITLADQPFVTSQFLNEIIDLGRINADRIIATAYSKTIGVPALFPKKYFEDLLLLNGKEGAKALLKSLQNQVITIKPGFRNLDIDTPENYQALQ